MALQLQARDLKLGGDAGPATSSASSGGSLSSYPTSQEQENPILIYATVAAIALVMVALVLDRR